MSDSSKQTLPALGFLMGDEEEARLAAEIHRVVGAIQEGDISIRADLDAFVGREREILRGINRIIDAMAIPIQLAATRLETMNEGDVPEEISEELLGEFAILRDNLNGCIRAMREVPEMEEEPYPEPIEKENMPMNDMHLEAGIPEDDDMPEGETSVEMEMADSDVEMEDAVEELPHASPEPQASTGRELDMLEADETIHRLLEYHNQEMARLGQILNRLSDGDLSEIYEAEEPDESTVTAYDLFHEVGQSLNRVVQDMRETLLLIEDSAEKLTARNDAASEAKADQAKRSHAQGDLEERLAEAHMAMYTQAEHCSEAVDQVDELLQAIEDSGQYADQQNRASIEPLQNLRGRLQKMSRNIRELDKIFHKNAILSMNAAMEAERSASGNNLFQRMADELERGSRRGEELANILGEHADEALNTIESLGNIQANLVAAHSEVRINERNARSANAGARAALSENAEWALEADTILDAIQQARQEALEALQANDRDGVQAILKDMQGLLNRFRLESGNGKHPALAVEADHQPESSRLLQRKGPQGYLGAPRKNIRQSER
ncbi:MAG: hypothetical protein ACLFUS_03885 [Candidatus Sumerlaeia bacterium]